MNPEEPSLFSLSRFHADPGDSPRMSGPTYPVESACWACGTVVTGSPTVGLRRCSNGHDEVTWREKLPGVHGDWRPPAPEVTTPSPG
jgi:hypothetical protein